MHPARHPHHRPHRHATGARIALVWCVALALCLTSCSDDADESSTAPTTTSAPSTGSSEDPSEPDPEDGTDDPASDDPASDDSAPDDSDVTTANLCRSVELGGLTVDVDCDAPVPDPESGVTLVEGSVYALPGESFDELAEVDATNRVVQLENGEPVIIYLLGSDTLFDVGSSTVKPTAEAALPAVIASIEQRAPGSRILVRGFTDSSGAAAANQALSEARASAMVEWLVAHGVDRARLEAAGYGSSHPAALEDNEFGTALNRRIEIVAVG